MTSNPDTIQRFFANEFTIIDKERVEVPFILNRAQEHFLHNLGPLNNVLKNRKQGISSVSLAYAIMRFLLGENERCVSVSFIENSAQQQLQRAKHFLQSYERINNVKVPLKYNSKYELHNAAMNSKYIIGTAQNVEVGRSRTITNAHLSEGLFYPHFRKILASLLQSVVPDGKVMIESTANGFNEGKEFWDETERGNTGFNPIFLPASFMYDKEFLRLKKMELGRLYDQEYPEHASIAFLTSGSTYFEQDSVRWYLDKVKKPVEVWASRPIPRH